MYIYQQQFVDDVLSDLDTRVQGRVCDLRSEIQDGGSFLLITGQVTSEIDEAGLLGVHDEIKEFLSKKFPDRYGDYSWMTVIHRGEEIVCTVFSNLLV
jgi:hypothetical protein